MKKSVVFFTLVLALVLFSANRSDEKVEGVSETKSTVTEVKGSSGSNDTLVSADGLIDPNELNINLNELPEVQELYDVSKIFVGKYARIFIAIKIEESGAEGKYSWLAQNHNNLMGMRLARARYTYAVGATNTNYAIYRNWFECMLDFKVYLETEERKLKKRTGKGFESEEDVLQYLARNFNTYDTWNVNIRKILRTWKYS